MKNDIASVVASGLKSATQGATLAGAGSIVSGLAMASKPVTVPLLFWEVTVGTTAVVVGSTVAAAAVGGAAVFFGVGALAQYFKNKRTHQEFDAYLNEPR